MQCRIDRVELYNFKSYNGRLTVGPFKDFTCIVGPNGAGKSNIMDALSFVLSRTTQTSTLRGRRALDFINRKATRKECEVAIVLRKTAEGGRAAQKSAETVFARRVDASGEVQTLLNGKPISEKIFFETLEQQFHISARVSTFLVFQHEVEGVAQKKAKELTELLEKVSGSGELKQTYAEKKKALEHANAALTSASADKRGAALAVNQMRLVKKDAEKFDELRRRLVDERRDMALAELLGAETELERQKAELDKFTKHLCELQKDIATEQELREMKRTYTELHRGYLEDLKTNRKTADELRGRTNALDRVKAALAHLQHKHDAQSAELQALAAADGARSKEVARLQEQLAAQQEKLAAFDAQCTKEDKDAAATTRALDPAVLDEYHRLRREADCETVTLRQELLTIRRQRDAQEAAAAQLAAAKESLEQQQTDLTQGRARVGAYVRELNERQCDLSDGRKTLAQQLEQGRRELQVTQRRNTVREAELAKVQEQLHELRFVKENDRQHSRMADALQALRSLFPIRGRLVDLCTVPNNRYRPAVTAALGRNLEAIVVNTAETAIACVRYLKEQRMPPITFLPLDSVSGAAVDDRLRTFGGTCKPLIDVVHFDAELEPAVRYALGQTLVCDGMAEAKKIAYGSANGERFKVVTVDGTTLLKNGSVQGGLASLQSRARKWDEKKYDDLRAARDRLVSDAAGGSEAELVHAQVALRDMEARLEFNKNRLNVVEAERTTAEAKLKALVEEAARLESTTHALAQRAAQLAKDKLATDKALLHASQAVTKVEQRVFADFKKRVDLSDLKQLEGQQATLAKQRAEHRQQLQLLIHHLERAVETATQRIGGQSAADLKEAITRLAAEMTHCKSALAAQQGGLQTLERIHTQARAAVAKTREQLDQLEQKIRQVTRESETMLNRLAHARKGTTGLQVACDTLRLRRLAIVRRCQMDETELPLTAVAQTGTKRGRTSATATTTNASCGGGRGRRPRGGSSSHNENEEEDEEVEVEEGVATLLCSEPFPLVSSTNGQPTSATTTAGAEGGNVCIDFSGMTDALRCIASDRGRFVAYKQRAEALVESLTAEMESLVPNLKAATRFVATEDRLGASSTALEAAREQARRAHTEFEQVKQLRCGRFMEVYDKVAASVDRVYRELTLGTRAHAVHGSAYLSLEDVEEPYLSGTTYHATPPLKSFMPMELLSGGERTMAALALLFAIHAVSPTPFFVLDEVDAALDAGNVEKLARYLRANCGTCQFIVVSLKDQLYHLADMLVGVTKDKVRESSKVLTMDLKGYAF